MNNPIVLTEDEFDERYPLQVNHLDPHATWAFGDGSGCLFGLSDPEIEFVRRQDPLTVWTLVDDDYGELAVISGMHFVNRHGYLVSTIPRPPDQDFEIPLDSTPETKGENP